MTGTPKSTTYTLAAPLLLVVFALTAVGVTLAPGARVAEAAFGRFWLVVLGQARAVPMYVLMLIRFGLLVATILI